MTGRGSARQQKLHRVIQRSAEYASVKVPITLSTSPELLDLASDAPFHIVVTAHNPSDKAITFAELLTPFMSERWGAFEDIECVTTPGKKIKIFPVDWPHWLWNNEDVERESTCTIPASGSLRVEHAISKDAIKAANLLPGERYQIKFTAEETGSKWWSYGTLDDLKHLRFRTWRPLPEFPDLPEGEEDLMQKEWREMYGTGPWTFGEIPQDLCFVATNVAEFEVAGAIESSMSTLKLASQD